MDTKSDFRTYNPDTYRTGIDGEHVFLEFGSVIRKTEADKLSNDDVRALGRIVISPDQLMPLIVNLSVAGHKFQQRTGEDIGFSFLDKQEDAGNE